MRSRGIALGIVVAVILVLFTIAFGILKLMRGAGHQMLYADAHIRALSIAESGVQLLVARMLAKPWDERWFKGAPDARGDPIQFEGGSYVYIIQDSPGISCSADIWVRGEYRSTKRLLFYRVKYEDMLFKGMTNADRRITTSFDDDTSGALQAPEVDSMTREVNDLIRKREDSRGTAREEWERIAVEVDPIRILNGFGAQLPVQDVPARVPSKSGVPTIVVPRPLISIPAPLQPNVPNYDRYKIFECIERQRLDSELKARLHSYADSQMRLIDQQVTQQQFLTATQTLKRLLIYLYTRSGIVNTAILRAKANYQAALEALDAQARQEGWTQQQLDEKKEQARLLYQAQLVRIFQEERLPDE